jgi:rare lipoprotein A
LAALAVWLAAAPVLAANNPPRVKVQRSRVQLAKPLHTVKHRPAQHKPKQKPKCKQQPKPVYHPKPQAQPQYYTFIVTAYTANDAGMNGKAITASGTVAIPWRTVAASRRWPLGTEFRTPSGQIWEVSDRGGAIQADNRLDLYVGKHDVGTAYQWGVQRLRLQLIKLGEGQ